MYEPLLDRWKGRSPGKKKENKDARKDKPLAHRIFQPEVFSNAFQTLLATHCLIQTQLFYTQRSQSDYKTYKTVNRQPLHFEDNFLKR